MLGCEKCDVTFDGKKVICESGENKDKCVTLADISTASMCGNDIALSVTNTHTSPNSQPPFMVGAQELEVDLLTRKSRVVTNEANVDSATPVKTHLIHNHNSKKKQQKTKKKNSQVSAVLLSMTHVLIVEHLLILTLQEYRQRVVSYRELE